MSESTFEVHLLCKTGDVIHSVSIHPARAVLPFQSSVSSTVVPDEDTYANVFIYSNRGKGNVSLWERAMIYNPHYCTASTSRPDVDLFPRP